MGREGAFMTYFMDRDSIALTEGNDLVIQGKYQEALDFYRKEMADYLKGGDYADFARLFQSLADCYYLTGNFDKAGDCYFAIVAYNIWQYPDIIYDYAVYNIDFATFISGWGTHLGYTLYGWDSEYADYVSGKMRGLPSRIKEPCSDIGVNRLLVIFEQLKKDSQIERSDIPEDKPISAREYYLFNKDICIKVGKELFRHVVFEKLNFTAPPYFRK